MSQMWSIYVPTGTHFEKMDQSVCVCERELEAEGLGLYLFICLSVCVSSGELLNEETSERTTGL